MKSLHVLCLALALSGSAIEISAETTPLTKWKYPTKAFPWVTIVKEEEVTMSSGKGYLSPGGVKVKVGTPRALTGLSELEALNPGLSKALPDLPLMLKGATIAPEFAQLYASKKKRVLRGNPLEEYNYFDCATVLRLSHPKTQRAVLFIQADMDVDTDGSDPVRFGSEEDYADSLTSRSFLPMLSYRWDQPAGVTHPLIPYFKNTVHHLTQYQAEVHAGLEKGTYPLWQRSIMRQVEEACELEATKLRETFIRRASGRIPGNVRDMQSSSSLLGTYDPFIVIPSNWFGDSNREVKIGDYAVVIVNQKVYPAIVADAGPTAQCGEASLKICREIEPKSSGIFRAVNGPKATYLVFTHSATGSPGPLNTDALRKTIDTLLSEIGSVGAPEIMHAW